MNKHFISVFSVLHFCPRLSCAQMEWACPEFHWILNSLLCIFFLFLSSLLRVWK